MSQPQLLTATRILERTMPATVRRMLLYGAIALAHLSSILLGAGTFYGLASFAKNPGIWGQLGATLGLVACFYVVRKARPILFYRVDLVHLAAMVKRLTGQDLPSGKEQLEQLDLFISRWFSSATESLACYRKIQQFAVEVGASLSPLSRLCVLPKPLAWWLQTGLATVLSGKSHAEALLALAVRGEGVGDLRYGAAVLCQHYRQVFQHSLIASAFVYGLALFAFWLFLKPVAWVDDALPSDFGFWQYVFALILTYWIKAAFLDPIATAALTIKLLQLEEQTAPSEELVQEWSLRLPSLAQLTCAV